MSKETTVKLIYRDKIFAEPKNDEDTVGAIAVLDINPSTHVATLTYTPDAGLIDKRTSQRQAQSICKTGFQLESGKRVGTGCELQVSSAEVLSDRLLQASYHYK